MKKFIYCSVLLLLIGVVSLPAVAGAWPSDVLAISGSNGSTNCGPTYQYITEKNGYERPIFVSCSGSYSFGNETPASDTLQYLVRMKMTSDSGHEAGGPDPGEHDVISVVATATSYPDGSPFSDQLTVVVKDTMGLFNFSATSYMKERVNGKDNPPSVTIRLPQYVATFPGGSDTLAFVGGSSFKLTSFPDPGIDGQVETSTQSFTIYAGSDVPEPGTLVLLGTGLIGLAGIARKRIRR